MSLKKDTSFIHLFGVGKKKGSFSFVQVSGFAFAGYAAGIAAYLAVHNLHISLPTTVAQVPFLSGS